MHHESLPRKNTYAGLFMITLATLSYEILLTRIFSVTIWYHYAFMAISVAMFGMTMGAIVVYLLPNHFTGTRVRYQLGLYSLLFALSIVASFLAHLHIRFTPELSLVGLYSIALTYVVICVPFVLSGVCVSLALTKFAGGVSKLYAADLAGAAIGCVVLVYALRMTDGPTAVIAVAALAGIGAALFAVDAGSVRLVGSAVLASLLLVGFVVPNTFLVNKGRPLLRLRWVKDRLEPRPLYEKWNSFSRITVWGNPTIARRPSSPGLSPVAPREGTVRLLSLTIDATAQTVITDFGGDLANVDYLRYDVTNLVHHIRPGAKVLIVGAGGGVDVLAALAFRQPAITAVEMNKEIIEAVTRRFGDFTGHLDRDPRVTFVADEARSYISRQKKELDIIQVPFIDTWAATAAGAFVLSEQSLYTVEAWKVFLQKLSPRGVLSFSRWFLRDRPDDMLRLTSLARASLEELGVEEPRKHIVIVRTVHGADRKADVGSILVGKEPFSEEDLDTIENVARALQFEVVLSPRLASSSAFASIASSNDLAAYLARFPVNLSAPRDDSPFFFHFLRLGDIFNRHLWQQQGMNRFNLKAVFVLGALLIIVSVLTLLCIFGPLLLTARRGAALKGALPLMVFFASIGFGFMLVEISQMQRLVVFLGHPSYALSVVLFSLLLSSSLGSYLTHKTDPRRVPASGSSHLLLLLGALLVFGLLTPYVTSTFRGAITPLRILAASGILFSLGVFMGMPFPLGLKLAASSSPMLTPWLWGVNGATSVCASVLAVAIAMTSGISTSFWIGCSCYALALLTFAYASKRASY